MTSVLYVTPQPPSLGSGGGRHCYANLRALCSLADAEVAYVGPPIEETLPGIRGLRILAARHYRLGDKVRAALWGASSSLVGLFAELPGSALDGFDLAFVEFTKTGFAVSRLAGRVPTVCSVHNVEADFMGRGARGFSRLAAANVACSEATSIAKADHLLVLHRHDLSRLHERYGVAGLESKAALHPACAFGGAAPLPYASRRTRIVIPGSLDQPYNEEGIFAFLDEAWPGLGDLGVELVVAGRNPGRRLRERVRAAGGTLVENPPSMEEIVRDARAVLVPDLGGAGMKVRVAEALSLGVPVVGTRAGLLGYDRAEIFGAAVPTIGAMAEAIRKILESPSDGARLAEAARTEWEVTYSFEAFEARIHRFAGAWARGGR